MGRTGASVCFFSRVDVYAIKKNINSDGLVQVRGCS